MVDHQRSEDAAFPGEFLQDKDETGSLKFLVHFPRGAFAFNELADFFIHVF